MPERIVEVEWTDVSTTHGWHKKDQESGLSPCLSVGYLVEENDEYLVLAESLDESVVPDGVTSNNLGCTTSIPRSAIRKITELRHA
jgi:hypothetical protein